MSKCHKDSVTCPRCKSTGDFIVWDSINVDIDEDLREKVKDKSVFITSRMFFIIPGVSFFLSYITSISEKYYNVFAQKIERYIDLKIQ